MAAEKKERRAAPRKTETSRTEKSLRDGRRTPGAEAPSAEELRRRIEIAAYYRAEARGFAPGGELEDWLAAEREIRRGQRA